jgi:hypothetical protein
VLAKPFTTVSTADWDAFLNSVETELDNYADVSGPAPTEPAQHWAAPSQLPPLTAVAAERVRAVLAKMEYTRAQLLVLQRDVGSQLAAIRSIPTRSDVPVPIYLDTAG